ncbi:MAG TPA: DUF4350 domain-containing protein [Anaerolineales bacterium]|nr:DUF4350 domain-containing protein [Anaerolineales bacterium]
MNRKWIWIALVLFLLPIAAHAVWFYTGIPVRPQVKTPDYKDMTMPLAPLSTPQSQDKLTQLGGVVVFDGAHTNQYQPGEIQALTDELERRGASVEFDTVAGTLANRLKYASTYVIVSPSVGFSSDDIHSITAFVKNGGRLLVFTDATRGLLSVDYFTGAQTLFPDVNAINPLLASFDITVNNDYLYNLTENEGNFRNVYFDQFSKNELTFGLKEVAFYGTHSVESPSGQVLLLGDDKTLSSLTDAHSSAEGGAVLNSDGNVLVFGDFTFLSTPYNGVADNATLIANIADFVLGGTRQHMLADFPYIFNSKSVQVFPTSNIQMTAEMVGALGGLQAALKTINTDVQVTDSAPVHSDAIILGTFTSSDDLLPFIKPFGISLDKSSDYVELPHFGKVGTTGNGLLLFQPNQSGNTLILLADTDTDLTTLLTTLSSGSISGCILQDNMGICSIGSGSSFSVESTPEATPSGSGTTPTPTPAG